MGPLVPPVPGGTGQTLGKAVPGTEVLACVWSQGQGAGAACALPTRLGRRQPKCADKPRATVLLSDPDLEPGAEWAGVGAGTRHVLRLRLALTPSQAWPRGAEGQGREGDFEP